jgi:hypothetical protein
MDGRGYWPLFVLAAFFFTATGFPLRSSVYASIDLSGMVFVATAVQFLMLCGVAVALKRELVDLRRAICLATAGVLCCLALSEPGAVPIRWLLPLPIVAIVAWQRGSPEQSGWLASLPRPAIEALGVGCAVVGAGMLSSGLDYFRFGSGRFDYFEIFVGGSIYAVGLSMILTGLDRRGFIQIVQGAYALCLALLSLVLIFQTATTPSLATDTFVNLLVCAMLLFRAWQLFLRPDGWLKMIETCIGGILVALSMSYMVDFERAWGAWAMFGLPMLAVAVGLCLAGMRLIWSDRIWLKRFNRTSTF